MSTRPEWLKVILSIPCTVEWNIVMALTVPFLWFICLSYSIYERNRRDWSCSEQLDATAVFSADLRIPLCDDVRGKSLARDLTPVW